MNVPTTLQGFMTNPGTGTTDCFFLIKAEFIDDGSDLIAYAAGWGRDKTLYALVYDPRSEDPPIKLYFRRKDTGQWQLGQDLSRTGWQREWCNSNVEEIARGAIRATALYRHLKIGQISD